ncbi:MAG TPA: DUF1987 domain-containing protein [Tenuifilaceae bacterium]|jgi:hypothetical protein|nr:DUF1987 domain-containing protein [Bacteroidales bacterium]HNT41018.1 DUF1987 domain-containing protein [Tenuifilaceae bacterium]MBP8643004.1 DUF1987 domain-containing protein [Bacteroidales bacterium]NLI87924.1 DUF1987 domain-containing protein [Bacteroidales bacterium]HNY08918.1 DUF1987 domain-containing protein [Tenuifilaceae bacterium]
MEAIKIQGTSQYPTIVLDSEAGRFEFSGNSLPEDPKAFYEPILSWLDAYAQNPNPETVVRFKMVYYNTPSSKQIFQIFKKFEKMAASGHKVSVVWAYNEDDIDIKDAGKDLSDHIKLPFRLESYKE